MDINVRTQVQQSEINGLFNDIEALKKERQKLKDSIDKKTKKSDIELIFGGRGRS